MAATNPTNQSKPQIKRMQSKTEDDQQEILQVEEVQKKENTLLDNLLTLMLGMKEQQKKNQQQQQQQQINNKHKLSMVQAALTMICAPTTPTLKSRQKELERNASNKQAAGLKNTQKPGGNVYAPKPGNIPRPKL